MKSFSMPHISAGKVKTAIPQAPKIHPAAQIKTRVRLPDTGPIGADTAPIVPDTGRI